MLIGSNIANAFSQALALSIMGFSFMKLNHILKLTCFLLLFGTQIIFISFFKEIPIILDMGVVICSLVISVFINFNLKDYLKSINIALSIFLVYAVVIFILGGFNFFIIPKIFPLDRNIFNISMQLGIVFLSVIVHKFNNYFFSPSNKDIRLLQFYLAFKILLVMVFFIGFPMLRKYYADIYYIVFFPFAIFLIMSIFFIHYNSKLILALENKNKKAAIELTERHVEAENLGKRYDEIIKFKHYVIGLYRSTISFITENDMDGLKEYYVQYIAPMHDKLDREVGEYKQIEHIQIKLIKTRIVDLINTVSQLNNVRLYLHINNVINNVAMNEMDLFTILNIYIDNAVEETEKQERGVIEIHMIQTHEKFIFAVRNSLVGNKSTPKPHNTHKGIEIVMEIHGKYHNMAINIVTQDDMFIQSLEVSND